MTINPREIIEGVTKHLEKAGKTGILEKTASLVQVLHNFNDPNRMIVTRTFIETGKVLASRQTRLRKPQLKMREVREVLDLITYHYSETSSVPANSPPLSDFLGVSVTETMAREYYDAKVMGQTADVHGRKIVIPSDGHRHMYKDSSGAHTVAAANFQGYRAKRLPWIRATLNRSREIYKKRESEKIVYAYIQCFDVPTHTGGTQNYLMVIARKDNPQADIRFITSYHIDDHETLLKHIEDFEPFYCTPAPRA